MSLVSAKVENSYEELYGCESSFSNREYRLGCWLLGAVLGYGVFGQISAVLASAGLGVNSRMITVPSRALLLSLALASLFALLFRPDKLTISKAVVAYLCFWIAFGCRILIVAATRVDVVVETGRFTLGFIATMAVGGVFLPALSVMVNSCWDHYRYVRNVAFSLAIGSGSVAIIFYGSTFTNFEHRMSAGESAGSVDTINSLAIGYLGAALVVIALYFLVCSTQRRGLSIVMSIVVGGMGLFLMVGSASRGPVVCSGATGFFLLLAQARQFNFKRLLVMLGAIAMGVTGIFILTQITGSTVLDRLLGIGYAIQTESEGASRLDLYEMALSEISNSPIFGSSLTLRAEDGTDMYPHNLFLEALLSTGLVGTIPLGIVLIFAFRAAWLILTKCPDMGWVALFFVLFFMYQMFGGAIYASGQFWISTAAVISCGEWVRRGLEDEKEEQLYQ